MSREDVRSQVLDILRNHERERRVIEAQIEYEKLVLARDVDEIASGGYPSMALSADKVTSSKASADGAMVNMVDLISKRKARSEALIDSLSARLRKIDAVQDLVLQMDSRNKTILIALYYPYRTYAEASALLDIDTATLARQRSIALERLCFRACRNIEFK